jgi:oligoendopeptidase F
MGAVRVFVSLVAATLLIAAVPAGSYFIDASHYFPSPDAEARSRANVVSQANAFIASPTPSTIAGMRRWLDEYDGLLQSIERHDIYVDLRAEENQNDIADAKADDALGALMDRVRDRVVEAARQFGSARITRMTEVPMLAPYRYLLEDSYASANHRLNATEARTVELTVTPVLDAAASTYKTLRRSPNSFGPQQDAYAALLISIAAAHNGVARLRGFRDAPEASYFDKSLVPASVERTLLAVRASTAYGRYRSVAALAPKPGFAPAPRPITEAIPIVLAAEAPMGAEYAGAFAALLDSDSHRLEICTAAQCDTTGFSLGFSGVDSAVYYGGYDGTVDSVRAVAHESGHAVHRHFMSSNQPIAAYNQGPSFLFESFAIFNELLLLDHLYRTAPNDVQRGYYLNSFLKDATFQVFGSAEETALESAIYRGVDDGTIRGAADLDALTTKVFSEYDSTAANDPQTSLYWARDRLFFTDPLYDVNYLFAGLLALRYFSDFQRDPGSFARAYVALLKNGFNDTPAALERRFLAIDLRDEPGLVASAASLIETRTVLLAKLYASGAGSR